MTYCQIILRLSISGVSSEVMELIPISVLLIIPVVKELKDKSSKVNRGFW